MTITEVAKQKILDDLKIRAAFMVAFGMTEQSVTNWVKKNDIRLTTKASINILIEHTGLTESEILEPEPQTI